MTRADFNLIFIAAQRAFIKQMHDDLRCDGINTVVNGWARTGLYPFNPDCEYWRNAIEGLGNVAKLGRGVAPSASAWFSVRADLSTLSDDELQVLQSSRLERAVPSESDADIAERLVKFAIKRWRAAKLLDESSDAGAGPCAVARIPRSKHSFFVTSSTQKEYWTETKNPYVRHRLPPRSSPSKPRRRCTARDRSR